MADEQTNANKQVTEQDRDYGSAGTYRLMPSYSLMEGIPEIVQQHIARMYPGWRVQSDDDAQD